MEQDTLWTDGDDQDLDAHLTARVEALLADPQFLAWLDQRVLPISALDISLMIRYARHPHSE